MFSTNKNKNKRKIKENHKLKKRLKFALVFLGSLPRITGVSIFPPPDLLPRDDPLQTPNLKWIIILPPCVRFSNFKNRLKTETQGFQTAFEIWRTDTTRPSYDRLKFAALCDTWNKLLQKSLKSGGGVRTDGHAHGARWFLHDRLQGFSL